MRTASRTGLALVIVMLSGLGGCKAPNGGVTPRGLLKFAFGPSPKKLAEQAFESPDPDVRRKAVVRLSSHSWGRAEPYLKGYAAIVTAEIRKRGDRRHPTLICAALRALGRAGGATYLSHVLVALKDPSPEVRWDAAAALDNMIGEEAVVALRSSALSDASVDVRAACCRALRHYRRQDVINTLVRCLGDDEFAVRYQAHRTLKDLAGRDFGPDGADWAGVRLDKLPVGTEKKKPWWNPINWFR